MSSSDRRYVGYVPGAFDLFHIGHLSILEAAAARCDLLIAGVASAESVARMKGHAPVIPLRDRMRIVGALAVVDEVVVDFDEDKRLAWHLRPFDVVFKGDDWQGTSKGERLEERMRELGVEVVYLPYTHSVSTTRLRIEIGIDVADHPAERLRVPS